MQSGFAPKRKAGTFNPAQERRRLIQVSAEHGKRIAVGRQVEELSVRRLDLLDGIGTGKPVLELYTFLRNLSWTNTRSVQVEVITDTINQQFGTTDVRQHYFVGAADTIVLDRHQCRGVDVVGIVTLATESQTVSVSTPVVPFITAISTSSLPCC